MKVLLINGSPRREGCTHTALAEIAAELEKQGIDPQVEEGYHTAPGVPPKGLRTDFRA